MPQKQLKISIALVVITFIWTTSLIAETALDILTTSISTNTVELLLDQGSSTVSVSVTNGPVQPNCIAKGDLDNDGDLDFVVSFTFPSHFQAIINNGNDTFSFSPLVTLPYVPMCVSLADMDRNGTLDLIIPTYGQNLVNAGGPVMIFLNDGRPYFSWVQAIYDAAPPGPYFLGSALSYFDAKPVDVNLDGYPELALSEVTYLVPPLGTGFIPEGKIALYNNNSVNGSWQNMQLIGRYNTLPGTTLPMSPNRITSFDMNQDGYPDLVYNFSTQGLLGILLNDTRGSMQTPIIFQVERNLMSVTANDFNRDGKGDLAFIVDRPNSTSDDLNVALGDGSGRTFNFATFSVSANPIQVISEDMNADGLVDIAVSLEGSNQIKVFYNNTDLNFLRNTEVINTSTPPREFVIGDFRGAQSQRLRLTPAPQPPSAVPTIAPTPNAPTTVTPSNGNGTNVQKSNSKKKKKQKKKKKKSTKKKKHGKRN